MDDDSGTPMLETSKCVWTGFSLIEVTVQSFKPRKHKPIPDQTVGFCQLDQVMAGHDTGVTLPAQPSPLWILWEILLP